MRTLKFRRDLAALVRDTKGLAATEFVLIAPILFLILIGTFSLFDWLRASYVTERATFTVADVISRQTEKNDAFFQTVQKTFFQLAANDVGEPQLRIMSLLRKEEGFEVDWTYNSKAGGTLALQPVPYDDLPDIAVNDSVIVTQSVVTIVPTFALLFDTMKWEKASSGGYQIELDYTASTRPRFVGRIAEKQ